MLFVAGIQSELNLNSFALVTGGFQFINKGLLIFRKGFDDRKQN